jgi:hypothetical protein
MMEFVIVGECRGNETSPSMDAPESHSDHDAILLTRDRLITGPFRR